MSRTAVEPSPDFQQIFESLPGVNVVINRDLKIVVASNDYLHATKARHEDVVGRSITEVFPYHNGKSPSETLPHLKASLERVLQKKTHDRMAISKIDFPHEAPPVSHSRFWSPLNAPIFDRDGNVQLIIHQFQDLTEQTRLQAAEENLEADKQRLLLGAVREVEVQRQQTAVILENISDAFFSLNTNWQFTYLNQTAYQLLDKSGHNLIGRNIWEVFPEMAESRFGREYRQAFQHKMPVVFEELYPNLNSWFSVHVVPSATGLSVYFKNISARKTSEAKLLEQARLAKLRAEISLILADGTHFQTILQRICQSLVDRLDVAFARIWTLNPGESVLELQASAGLYTHVNGPHGRVNVGDFKIGRIAKNRRPHISNNVPDDPEVSNQEWARREGMVAFAGYPLMLEEDVLGVMALFARFPISDTVLEELAFISRGVTQWISRQNAEKELHKQQEWFKVTLASIGDGVIATDASGKVTFMNAVAQQLTAWEMSDALNHSLEEVFNIINEDTRAKVESPVAKVLREKIIVGLANHTILIAKDGREVFIDDSAAPIVDAQNKIVGVVMVFHEIGDRRRLEKENARLLSLEKEARREAEILNRIGTLLAADLDLEKLAQSATDAATELAGATFGVFFYFLSDDKEELTLFTVTGLPRERFSEFKNLRKTKLFGPTFKGGHPIRIADVRGDWRCDKMGLPFSEVKEELPIASYLAVPVISRTGEVIGGMFFGHPEPDIFTELTERLLLGIATQTAAAVGNARTYRDLEQARQKLTRQAEELEQRIEERTAKLQESISELESYSYSISHDMRAPLRAMKGYSDILLEECAGKLSADQQRYLNRIGNGARRLDGFIQDVLSYSRISRSDLHLVAVDVERLTRDIIDQYPGLQLPQARVEIASQLPLVLANEATLTQCISNLLGNAVKFVAPGVQPQVKVWSESRDGMVTLFFQDNGIGIAEKDLERIFSIFVKVHPPETYTGTGIGLSIVRKAVEKMGGQVGVVSTIGQGSQFWLQLHEAKI